MAIAPDILDRILNPIGDALGKDAARRLVELRADPGVQQRVDELAEKGNEGLLTPEERMEYESLVDASAVVSVLQAKARKFLLKSPDA